MATTRLIPMHIDHSIGRVGSIAERVGYAMDGKKTAEGSLVMSYKCDARTAIDEMILTRRMHEAITGRETSGKNEVLLYQIRQSFKPGEVTPELALEIGHELAMRFTKGQHQYIVATHVDHAHIHNHILFNAITTDHSRKFRNFYGSSRVIREISDNLCLEHGLSVVEKPDDKREHEHYGKWLGNKRPIRWKDRLRLAIDMAIAQNPTDFDSFRALLMEQDIEYRDGRNPSIRVDGQLRFTSLRTLGDGYAVEELCAVINGEKAHTPRAGLLLAKGTGRPNLILDIQQKLQEGKGAGFERWAKVYNLKQMARSLSYVMEHRLTDWNSLARHAPELEQECTKVNAEISQIDRMIATKRRELCLLQNQTVRDTTTRCNVLNSNEDPILTDGIIENRTLKVKQSHPHGSTGTTWREKVIDTEIRQLLAKRSERMKYRNTQKQQLQECRFVQRNLSLFLKEQGMSRPMKQHIRSL